MPREDEDARRKLMPGGRGRPEEKTPGRDVWMYDGTLAARQRQDTPEKPQVIEEAYPLQRRESPVIGSSYSKGADGV
ncbi:MAG: hypothetical protein GY696_05530 [Gammaproteobacteria bacterium]|nr:hypothetical protein [Gammaproteobacteria bacterium]